MAAVAEKQSATSNAAAAASRRRRRATPTHVDGAVDMSEAALQKPVAANPP